MEHKPTINLKAILNFPSLAEPDENGKYSVQLGGLSTAAVDALQAQGVTVSLKEDDKYERGYYVTCRSKFPIKCLDPNGLPIEPDTVGYGSECRVQVTTYSWKYLGKEGVGVRVQKLVIDRLVEPVKGDPDLEDMEDAL